MGGGYSSDIDYYYFNDCALQQTAEYYEDTHGNKIIGKYEGLKFYFLGFHSVIEIGDNVQFQNTNFYVHNDSKVTIDNNVQFLGSRLYIHHSAEAVFEENLYLEQDDIVMKDETRLQMKRGCSIVRLNMGIEEWGEVVLGEEVSNSCCNRTVWSIGKDATFHVGNKGRFLGGECRVDEKALFKIGNGFSIQRNYRIVLNPNTTLLIGNDCMFSWDVNMRSNDGHSIFDIASNKNINSSNNISRDRKIVIGDHVWVGERAEILYNTQIGDGSVIGAMSLVKSRIPNNCIAAGIPARVIRKDIAWSRENGAEDILECGQEYIHYTEL